MFRSWVLIVALSLVPSALQEQAPAAPSQADLARGKQLFQAQCARCHGMLGLGGDGPSLARPVLRHAADDEALVEVIQKGIPRTGMPAVWALSDDEARQVAWYVRSLGRQPEVRVSGDADRGRRLFETTARCATCHIVNGGGTSGGPDLSDVGARRGADYLRQAIVDPAATLPEDLVPFYPAGYAQFLPVRVVTRSGHDISGVRVNEDAFTIQLRDLNGVVHSLKKHELASLEKQFGESTMPGYRDLLADGELDDLVAYLVSLRGER